MSRKARYVPQATKDRQSLASDPALSAWVSANAGSGKTHVLAQRVIRLLLEDTEPSRILCLTYTRAAAANMANRVFSELARWATLPDAELSEAIATITLETPDRRRISLARKLFARALETPGGLKIQTIHAFCEALLHQFPLEANIAGHFELMDSEMEAALVGEARRDMIVGAVGEHEPALQAAFAEVLARGGEAGLDTLLSTIVRERSRLREFLDQVAVDDVPFAAVWQSLGLAPGEGADAIAAAGLPLPGFDAEFCRLLGAAAVATDAAKVLKSMLPGLEAAQAEPLPARRVEHLAAALLTAKGEAYADSFFKKALVDRLPDVQDRYGRAVAALLEVRERLARHDLATATVAALTLADWLVARYERLKNARGLLDFADLIDRTVRLLAREDASAWVQYKLDQGIDHVLIDEAQDTSPSQWAVVKSLAGEFFAGAGARPGVERTVFAVGDEKQSIYSFQGAQPASFAESRHAFAIRARGAERRFESVELTQSFRSTHDVLSFVDLVFAGDEARTGLTVDVREIRHEGIRENEPGFVELWSSLGPTEAEEPDDWTQAIDHASAPAVQLAETIAETIRGWLKAGERLEGQGRPLRAGDVMVLVRKRGSFVHALSRALKNRNVPVAGADRLLLTDHIAVKDLLAIGRFVLNRHDDLSLAALLRSPIFDMAEERLFALAHGRGNASLHARIVSAAGLDPAWEAVRAELAEWLAAAGFAPCFEFYSRLLAGTPECPGLRSRLIARLGEEAGDVIDEFLNFCLSFEMTGSDGLEALVATLDSAAPEVKREMDQGRDEVRILTVHASKGLEAPVVFLVDSGGKPFHASHLPALVAMPGDGRLWHGAGFLWRAGAERPSRAMRELEAGIARRAEEEYRRLLYVGMTRAEDRLIVCGHHGAGGRQDGTWHDLVERAFAGTDRKIAREAPEKCQPVWRYRVTPETAVEDAEPARAAAPAAPMPEVLRTPLAPPPPLPRPLRPSGAALAVETGEDDRALSRSPVLDPQQGESFAQARGTALHRLLQMLPELPQGEREAAARRYLGAVGAAWRAEDRDQAWRSVEAILSEPAFAPLFGGGSRAEIAVMGTLEIGGAERAISGKIDRLAVSADEVLILDFKTNRVVPAGPHEVAESYHAQLALYAALLAKIYPGRKVRAALLYTAGPQLIELPRDVMDDALARLAEA